MSRGNWFVVYAREGERREAQARCHEEARHVVDLLRREGWIAWAELRSSHHARAAG